MNPAEKRSPRSCRILRAESDRDIRRCWPLVKQLRPQVKASAFVPQIRRQQAAGGTRPFRPRRPPAPDPARRAMPTDPRSPSPAEALRYRGRLAPSPTGYLHLGHASTFWTAQERCRIHHGTLILRN